MKISKRTREQAWLICAIAASNPDDGLSSAEFYLDIKAATGAFDLANQAISDVASSYRQPLTAERYHEVAAEAAALLAEGWCPP